MKANVSEARNKIKLNKLGKSMDPRLGCLRILFKEILQQIPLEKAEELRKAYLAGEKLLFLINQSSQGQDSITMFSFAHGDLQFSFLPLVGG